MDSQSPVSAARTPRIGLVVVHGVGETEPGYCVNALLETLATHATGYTVSPFSEFERLDEHPQAAERRPADAAAAAQGVSPQFVVARRRATHEAGAELTAVELYWADLTALQPGRLNTMLGLFRVIFESHHLVDAMLDRGRSVMSWILRKILWIAGWLLRGPIAALTIATSGICALLLFQPDSIVLANNDGRIKFLIVQMVLLVAAVYAMVRIVRTQEYTWYDAVFWLIFITAALIGLDVTGNLMPVLDWIPNLTAGTRASPEMVLASQVDCTIAAEEGGCYVNGLYKGIIWGWRIWGILLLIATAFLAFALTRARKLGETGALASVSTSIGILIIQFLLWTTVVVSVLYPMLNRAETNRALGKIAPVVAGSPEGENLMRDPTVAQLLRVPDIHADWIERFKFIYASAALTVLIFILAAWMLMLIRRARAKRALSGEGAYPPRMPRLLFNGGLMALLIIAFLCVIGFVFLQPQLETDPGFVAFRSLFLPFAALVALLTPLFIGHRITNVVHIARDLIDHHYSPRLEASAYFLPSVFRTRHSRPRRGRIEMRLIKILDAFVREEHFDHVIFVAHSQGSVVAYDYLRDNAPDYPQLGGAPPSMLSFGSPLGHIYQKYFCEYDVKIPTPEGLAARLSRWLNLSRIDDYIGGAITPPEGLRIENRVLGMGGHTGYWNLKELAAALDELVQVAPKPGAARSVSAVPRSMPKLFSSPTSTQAA